MQTCQGEDMKTIDFLDRCKEKLGVKLDSELAQAIGVKKSTLSLYKSNERRPDEYTCFQIAEILNLEPQAVISAVKAEGEQDPDKRRFWEQYARRYGVALTVPFLLAGTISLISLALPAPANAYESMNYGFDKYVLCEMRDSQSIGKAGLSGMAFLSTPTGTGTPPTWCGLPFLRRN